jgi:hypothetical protein
MTSCGSRGISSMRMASRGSLPNVVFSVMIAGSRLSYHRLKMPAS